MIKQAVALPVEGINLNHKWRLELLRTRPNPMNPSKGTRITKKISTTLSLTRQKGNDLGKKRKGKIDGKVITGVAQIDRGGK